MITPMVARLLRDPFDREDWFFELKWDGFRAIAEMDERSEALQPPSERSQKAVPTDRRCTGGVETACNS